MLKVKIKERPHGLWIFSDQIQAIEGEPEPGEELIVRYKDEVIGSGFYNPRSKVAIRIYSWKKEPLDRNLLRSRISDAFRFRKGLDLGGCYRLVFGESDLLPGLIIDRYQDSFVLQTLSFGMANRIPIIVETLKELFNPTFIYQKDNSQLRRLEGLKNEERILFGTTPEDMVIEQDGLRFHIDIRNGQKTGFYLDQRENRRIVKEIAAGRKVLDLFTYTGAFALYAKAGGATFVLGVDQSRLGIGLAEKNSQLNDLPCRFQRAEVFQFLKEHTENYDLIIIDPPSFTRTRKDRDRAMRSYLKLFLLAVARLNPYGMIVLSSCSHYLTLRDLITTVSSGSHRLRRRFRIFRIGHQSPDHPVLPGMPETEYLRCLFLQSF